MPPVSGGWLQVIPDASADSLEAAIMNTIEPETVVQTDGWQGDLCPGDEVLGGRETREVVQLERSLVHTPRKVVELFLEIQDAKAASPNCRKSGCAYRRGVVVSKQIRSLTGP